MTLTKFITEVFIYMAKNPDQRIGQAAFNALHFQRPDLSDQIYGTDLDPFYDDTRMDAFWAFIVENW